MRMPAGDGLTMTEDPQADAEKPTRAAHRAIEIRKKRRRVRMVPVTGVLWP